MVLTSSICHNVIESVTICPNLKQPVTIFTICPNLSQFIPMLNNLSQPKPTFPNIKAIIFDLDQTLLDSFETVVKAHSLSAKENYNLTIDENIIREKWGLPLEQFWQEIYERKDIHENLHKNVVAIRHKYNIVASLFKDVLELLTELKKNYMLAILTSTSTELTIFHIGQTPLPLDYFEFIQGSDQTEFHKPDPRVFDLTKDKLRKYKIKPEEMLYVGDSTHDYLSSKGAGINFVGVLTGLNSKEDFLELGLDESLLMTNLTQLKHYLPQH